MKKFYKKLLCITGSIFILSSFMSAVTKDEAKSILKKAQDNTCFYDTDMKGDYQVVYDKPGEGRSQMSITLFRRDAQGMWTILIRAPDKDKGKGYLQYDSNIWFYDPADKRFTFSSGRDKFQNTNANTSDFGPQLYAENFEIVSYEDVKLGKYDCVAYTLKSVSKSEPYPEIKLWVSKDDGLLRKREDYSLSKQRLRTIAIPSYQKINSNGREYSVPVNMVIQDHLKGKKIADKMEYEKTIVSISNVVLQKVDDSVYSKPYLEMMSNQ